ATARHRAGRGAQHARSPAARLRAAAAMTRVPGALAGMARGGPAESGGPTFVFVVLLVTSSMVNFDSGGTAAILVHLGRGCPGPPGHGSPGAAWTPDPSYPCLSESDKGVLCSAAYVGLCLGCPLAGELLRTRSEKRVLLLSLAGNVLATVVFSNVLNKHGLWAAKLAVGATQSAISIYAPVWVSKFAPPASKTLWYGLMQSSAAIGNLFGYAVCGYLVELGVYYQRAFQIQALWLAATCALLLQLPSQRIDVSAQPAMADLQLADPSLLHSKGLSSVPRLALLLQVYGRGSVSLGKVRVQRPSALAASPESGAAAQLAALLEQPMFLATGSAICGLYFVVTAVQYWASQFFVVEFGRSGAEVTTAFLFVAGSAPLLGVVIGSWIVDRAGGYETPEQVAHACMLVTSWGAVAALGGVLAVALDPAPPGHPSAPLRFYLVVCCVWVQLLFGGAALPAVTGVCMGSVPEGLRKSASSWAMVFYNVFGFSLGAYLPGCIAERSSLRLAMHAVFLSPLACCAAMALALLLARRAARGETGPLWGLPWPGGSDCAAPLAGGDALRGRPSYGTELTWQSWLGRGE
ncbi:unnamed protein product, partial [Prorocentrum cordatum]